MVTDTPQGAKTPTKSSTPELPVVPELSDIEAAKRLAAYAAVDNHVKVEHRVGSPPLTGVVNATT